MFYNMLRILVDIRYHQSFGFFLSFASRQKKLRYRARNVKMDVITHPQKFQPRRILNLGCLENNKLKRTSWKIEFIGEFYLLIFSVVLNFKF